MIDCENQIFTKLATALRTAYPGINVQGTVTYTPSVFLQFALKKQTISLSDRREILQAMKTV